jgi:hypothetical protein
LNVFEAVKQSVTTRQAASFYGIRVGRNGMVCCPFHNDRTPSMKVDSRFYCFGCGASGDVIDFAALLHGLGKREAAVRLAEDFGVSYEKSGNAPPDRKRHNRSQPRQKSAEQRFQETERYCFRVLCDYQRLLEHWKTAYAPQPQTVSVSTKPCQPAEKTLKTIHRHSIITFYFFFDFLVDMVDKGEKCPKYQAFLRQLAVNQSVNQTVNRWLFRMAVPFARLLLP